MNSFRANSSPQLVEQYYNDSALEGVAANVKLLLKLIQDHKVSYYKEKKDGRRMLRVATMMTILENIRSRIQKCQAFGVKRPAEEVAGEHLLDDDDEKARLRRELKDSLAARKNLEVMCSSLGREKEIIAAELAMKVHQLDETDELIQDLKGRNGTLLEKLHASSSESNEEITSGNNAVETQESVALEERNKMLSAQYLCSLDAYRAMKKRYKETQEENNIMCATMEEIGMKVRTSLEHIHEFKDSVGSYTDVQDQIIDLEHMFKTLELQVAKHEKKKGECLKLKGTVITHHPQIVS